MTKQGSRLVRWAVIEGTVRYHGGAKLAADYHRIAQRRGKNRATVAIARKILTLVYYGPRRRNPLPGQDRVTQLGHDYSRARNRHDPTTCGEVDDLLEPV